jgi:hypothetical protein
MKMKNGYYRMVLGLCLPGNKFFQFEDKNMKIIQKKYFNFVFYSRISNIE